MRVLYSGLILLLASSAALGQESSIGVAPYHHPEPSKYRALFGVGVNAGHLDDAPLTYLGSISFQIDQSLFGASLISSTNNSFQPPRNTLMEIDVLYGWVFDVDLARYEASPQSFHTSISSGVGLTTYAVRWRPFGRRPQNNGWTNVGQRPDTFDYSVCVPLQAQVLYEPIHYIGVGLAAFLSISKFTPSYGASVSVQARY